MFLGQPKDVRWEQITPLALRQGTVVKCPDPGSNKRFNLEAKQSAHAPYLPVATFVENKFQNNDVFAVCFHGDGDGLNGFVIQLATCVEALHAIG